MGKFRSLEMLRGVAALLVVLFHTQAIFGPHTGNVPFDNVFGAGYRGVDLFFVLSGFIISYVHSNDVGRPNQLPSYLFNRIVRIYPAVWIMTVLAVVLYSLGFGGAGKTSKLATNSILASAMLLPQRGDALVNVTWTLTYEMFFYVLYGTMILNRRIGLVLLLIWQLITAVVALLDINLGIIEYYFRSICLDFSIGLACAFWLRRPSNMIHQSVWFAFLAAGIGSFVSGMILDRSISWAGVPCALGSGAIVLALVRLEQARKLPLPNFLVSLGGASYAIYLTHFSVLTVFAAVLTRVGATIGGVVCVACAAAAVIAGLVFDRVADRPIQRWLRQHKPKVLGRD